MREIAKDTTSAHFIEVIYMSDQLNGHVHYGEWWLGWCGSIYSYQILELTKFKLQ